MSIDMTLIHTLQHQLQASERTHKAIFDSIPNAVFLLDAAELTILDCNPASVKMYGRQRENELIGRGILDLFLPEEREQYASQLRAFTVFSGVTNIKADGTPLRVDIRSASATAASASSAPPTSPNASRWNRNSFRPERWRRSAKWRPGWPMS